MTKLLVILVYMTTPASSWYSPERIEYPMPDMATCQEAVKAAKVSATKGSVAIFCAYKEKS